MAGDSIRAKYAGKIFQKKMLAEARREQAKLGMVPTVGPKASSKGWQAMPGAPALVRYLEVCSLLQPLITYCWSPPVPQLHLLSRHWAFSIAPFILAHSRTVVFSK